MFKKCESSDTEDNREKISSNSRFEEIIYLRTTFNFLCNNPIKYYVSLKPLSEKRKSLKHLKRTARLSSDKETEGQSPTLSHLLYKIKARQWEVMTNLTQRFERCEAGSNIMLEQSR